MSHPIGLLSKGKKCKHIYAHCAKTSFIVYINFEQFNWSIRGAEDAPRADRRTTKRIYSFKIPRQNENCNFVKLFQQEEKSVTS